MTENRLTPGLILGKREVIDHVLAPEEIRFVRLGDLLTGQSRSCVDGRGQEGVIGALGGDAGELVLALTAQESVSGQILKPADIYQAVFLRAQATKGFYLHTDKHALVSLFSKVSNDEVFNKYEFKNLGQLHRLLTQKMKNFRVDQFALEDPQERLLDWLGQPEFVGCGHLKALLTNSEAYGVRQELVSQTIQGIFQLMWQRPGLVNYEVLDGGHQEKAVIIVRQPKKQPLTVDSLVPLITPNTCAYQTFIYHPEAVEFVRRQQNPEAFLGELQTLGDKWLNLTLGRLAAGLPRYEAVFKPDGNGIKSIKLLK